MTFSHPAVLAVALALCLMFAVAFRFLEKRRTGHELAYSNLPFLLAATQRSGFINTVFLSAWVLGLGLVGAALAGPRLVATLPAKDGAVVICLDTSGSMAARDVSPTRFQAAKDAARAFVEAAPRGTKIAILAFSSTAGVVQPLSRDPEVVLESIDRIPEPNGATAIGDALALAAAQLPPAGHRLVIVITDGVNNRGVDPVQSARFLATRHVPVYTVGIGTNDSGQLIPGTNEPANIDEDALRALADAAGGAYARASDASQLHRTLSRLGRSATLEKRNIDARFPFAVGGAMVMLLSFLAGFGLGKFP